MTTRKDFLSENIEFWIDNWQRKDLIGNIAASWLFSFPFERVNVIVNHSSVVLEDFPEEIRHKIKLWPNVMRHDLSRGPINKNINQAYVHTFLGGKKYCILAHDSYYARPGWADRVINTPEYLFYSCPQGDGFHIQTLQGLKTFGWWDERYATMGWHEIDYLTRVLRQTHANKTGKASIVDIHRIWPTQLPFVNQGHELHYNSVGLEEFIERFDRGFLPSIQEHKPDFKKIAYQWHHKKWSRSFEEHDGTLHNIQHGPVEQEINWYPWLNLDTLQMDNSGY